MSPAKRKAMAKPVTLATLEKLARKYRKATSRTVPTPVNWATYDADVDRIIELERGAAIEVADAVVAFFASHPSKSSKGKKR